VAACLGLVLLLACGGGKSRAQKEFETALEGAQPATDIVLPTEGEFVNDKAGMEFKPSNVLRFYKLEAYISDPTGNDFMYQIYRGKQGDTLLVNMEDSVIMRISLGADASSVRLDGVHEPWHANTLTGLFEPGVLADALAAQKKAHAKYKEEAASSTSTSDSEDSPSSSGSSSSADGDPEADGKKLAELACRAQRAATGSMSEAAALTVEVANLTKRLEQRYVNDEEAARKMSLAYSSAYLSCAQ
jgi:hypothetical protein